jgi:hypothetical protein
LGPWTTVNGQGQDINIASGDSFVQADLWFPDGRNLKPECSDVSTIIEPGLTITVIGAAGQAWKYSSGCSREYVEEQIFAHLDRRGLSRNCIVSLSEVPTR